MIHTIKHKPRKKFTNIILDEVSLSIRLLVLNEILYVLRTKINQNVYLEIMNSTQDYHEY